MNKEYICVNNQVVISDEEGKLKTVPYDNNVEKKLITENLIEDIEEQIQELEETKLSRKNYWKHPLTKILSTSIILPSGFLLTYLMCTLIFGIEPEIVDSVFGKMPDLILRFITVLIAWEPIAIPISIYTAFKYKSSKKRDSLVDEQIHFLEKKLLKEKSDLEKLENSKEKETPQNIQLPIQNSNTISKSELLKFKKELELYTTCVCNEKKLLKYQQNNTLDSKLRPSYTESEINFIKEYLEEKKESQVVKKIGSR